MGLAQRVSAVDLDFLAGTRFNWAGTLAIITGAAGLIFTVWTYQDLDHKLNYQQMQIVKLKEQGKSLLATPVVQPRDTEQSIRETKQANAVILALSLPWKEFFEALEASQTSEVAVLTIEPNAQKGIVRISAEAKKLESMLAYVASLQKITMFHDVLVMSHQIQDQDPQKPIRFVIQASWETQR